MTKVTHFIYDGIMFHAVGDRMKVIEYINTLAKNPVGLLMDIPIWSQGKVDLVSFSMLAPMIIMDDHDVDEGDTAAPKKPEPSVILGNESEPTKVVL